MAKTMEILIGDVEEKSPFRFTFDIVLSEKRDLSNVTDILLGEYMMFTKKKTEKEVYHEREAAITQGSFNTQMVITPQGPLDMGRTDIFSVRNYHGNEESLSRFQSFQNHLKEKYG